MKFRIVLYVSLLIPSFALISPAMAQDDANDGVAVVVRITPEKGKGDDLVKAITKYHHWVADKEGHFEFNWYAISTGPGTGSYIARSGGHNWADLDADHDWDDEADKMFDAEVAPLIESTHRMVTRDMDDVSYWPENFEGYTHFMVEEWYIKNGQRAAFMNGLKTIHGHLTAAKFGSYYGFISVVSGGHGNQVQFVGPMKGWADMVEDDPSFRKIMTDAMGEDEFSEFFSSWAQTYKVGGNMMLVSMPGASDYGD